MRANVRASGVGVSGVRERNAGVSGMGTNGAGVSGMGAPVHGGCWETACNRKLV